MENDRIGLSQRSDSKKRSQKEIFNSKAQRLAEKEYEEYYNKIRQLSRGLWSFIFIEIFHISQFLVMRHIFCRLGVFQFYGQLR